MTVGREACGLVLLVCYIMLNTPRAAAQDAQCVNSVYDDVSQYVDGATAICVVAIERVTWEGGVDRLNYGVAHARCVTAIRGVAVGTPMDVTVGRYSGVAVRETREMRMWRSHPVKAGAKYLMCLAGPESGRYVVTAIGPATGEGIASINRVAAISASQPAWQAEECERILRGRPVSAHDATTMYAFRKYASLPLPGNRMCEVYSGLFVDPHNDQELRLGALQVLGCVLGSKDAWKQDEANRAKAAAHFIALAAEIDGSAFDVTHEYALTALGVMRAMDRDSVVWKNESVRGESVRRGWMGIMNAFRRQELTARSFGDGECGMSSFFDLRAKMYLEEAREVRGLLIAIGAVTTTQEDGQ